MIIVHAETAEKRGSSPHRPGGISFISLLKGEEGSPDNFELALLDIGPEYHAPRHRHNFDQIRVMLGGDFEWAPDRPQRQGTIGYFCEGTYYTQRGINQNLTLLLQCGGASGEGYMSARQLADGIAALTARGGSFTDGVYTWIDADGKKHNRDAYQAVWEFNFKRTLVYPRPRFELPVIFDPAGMAGLTAGPGVTEKDMGRLNERGLAVKTLFCAQGAGVALGNERHKTLLYVDSGNGSVASHAYKSGSAIQLAAGEKIRLSVEENTQLYVFELPEFSRQAASAAPQAPSRDQAA
ncbi:MAG: hypothetical protein SFV19_00640 [Rhodospirillaceae bacterium]|nr:hypothetical protein [Rhodospirillaceae bacterium]